MQSRRRFLWDVFFGASALTLASGLAWMRQHRLPDTSQIWRLNGIPLSDTALPAGETETGLIARYAHNETVLLEGQHFTSGGVAMARIGQSLAEVGTTFGKPDFVSANQWVYEDTKRRAFLTVEHDSVAVTRLFLSRCRVDGTAASKAPDFDTRVKGVLQTLVNQRALHSVNWLWVSRVREGLAYVLWEEMNCLILWEPCGDASPPDDLIHSRRCWDLDRDVVRSASDRSSTYLLALGERDNLMARCWAGERFLVRRP